MLGCLSRCSDAGNFVGCGVNVGSEGLGKAGGPKVELEQGHR